MAYYFLSIPSWSDFNINLKQTYSHKDLLSIPSWSDFNIPVCDDTVKSIPNFQSHLGLISTSHGRNWNICV